MNGRLDGWMEDEMVGWKMVDKEMVDEWMNNEMVCWLDG